MGVVLTRSQDAICILLYENNGNDAADMSEAAVAARDWKAALAMIIGG